MIIMELCRSNYGVSHPDVWRSTTIINGVLFAGISRLKHVEACWSMLKHTGHWHPDMSRHWLLSCFMAWGDDNFDDVDALVVCRQLGFSTGRSLGILAAPEYPQLKFGSQTELRYVSCAILHPIAPCWQQVPFLSNCMLEHVGTMLEPFGGNSVPEGAGPIWMDEAHLGTLLSHAGTLLSHLGPPYQVQIRFPLTGELPG